MKRAREKFAVGDRVHFTEDAYRHGAATRGPKGAPHTGTVTGFAASPWSVAVRRDGRKLATVWAAAFWDKGEVPNGDVVPSPSDSRTNNE